MQALNSGIPKIHINDLHVQVHELFRTESWKRSQGHEDAMDQPTFSHLETLLRDVDLFFNCVQNGSQDGRINLVEAIAEAKQKVRRRLCRL